MDTLNEKRDSLSVLLAFLPLIARFIAWLLSGFTINAISCIELSFCCITLCFTDISYIDKQHEVLNSVTDIDRVKHLSTLFRTLYWGTICCALIILGITYLDEAGSVPNVSQYQSRNIALLISAPLMLLPFLFKLLYRKLIKIK